MIRNDYKEAYKGGIVPTIRTANLIADTAKVRATIAKEGVYNTAIKKPFSL